MKLTDAMQSAIAKGTAMKDEVAEHEKAMEKKRKKLAESMRNSSKPKQKAKPKVVKEEDRHCKKNVFGASVKFMPFSSAPASIVAVFYHPAFQFHP